MNQVVVTKTENLTKGKIRVSFDTGLTCILYRSELYHANAYEGNVLSQEAYEELMTEIVGKRATKRAMHLLEKMDRTEANVRDKLRQGGYPERCIDQAIAYLYSYHYLDDERYARNLIRLGQENKSKQKLKMTLYAKGVSREVIEKTLEEEYESDESDQIISWLNKRNFDSQNADEKERSKTYQFLLRKGFKSSDILRCMKMNLLDTDR